MEKAGQKLQYVRKLPSTDFELKSIWNIVIEISRPEIPNFSKFCSTKFDLESNWKILNEKHRPEFPISLQYFLNGIWFRIKLKLTDWKKQARNSLIFANLP